MLFSANAYDRLFPYGGATVTGKIAFSGNAFSAGGTKELFGSFGAVGFEIAALQQREDKNLGALSADYLLCQNESRYFCLCARKVQSL